MAGVTPFDRVEAFTVTVAAGTTQAAPTSTDISFRPGYVVGIEIIIPDGNLGLAGIALASAHVPIVPHTAGAFIIGNDEKIEWPLQNETNTGNWQAITYNTDLFPHTFFIRFLIIELQHADTGGLTPQPLAL